ncbi:MAG TPA: hypothetical protein VLQ66_08825, partial [Paenisporosarcina sp.]|nr:hypothetical protein [Paenisporosarcina sp.]
MYRHMKHCQCSVPPMVRPAVQSMMHHGNAAPIQQPNNAPIQQPGVAPIVCPPLCRYTDSYVKREVPYIQPLINVNRQHIVDVPRTYYREINQ